MNKAREFDQSVVPELKALLGDRVSTSQAVREHHGKDESYFPYALPDVVVFLKSTEEVRDVVNICRTHRVPMIPYGVGTEGTLGIITEVTVKPHPVQAAMSAAVCSFTAIDGAAKTVIQTLQAGIPIARSELLCALTMKALNAHNKTSHREQPTLLLEFHGTEAAVVEQAELVQEIAKDNGGMDFQCATRT